MEVMSTHTEDERTAEKYLGKPCFRSHPGVRYVCNGECVECAALRHERVRRSGRSEYVSYQSRQPKQQRPHRWRGRYKKGEVYQGKPCKQGHDGTRYRCNGTCVRCSCKSDEPRIRLSRLIKRRKTPANHPWRSNQWKAAA